MLESVHLVFGPPGAGKSTLAHQAGHPVRRQRVLQRNVEQGETYSFDVTGPIFDVVDARFEPPSTSEFQEHHHD